MPSNGIADISLSEPGYSGAFTASSSAPAIASATITDATLTIQAVAAGTATISVKDSANNTATCGVTIQ